MIILKRIPDKIAQGSLFCFNLQNRAFVNSVIQGKVSSKHRAGSWAANNMDVLIKSLKHQNIVFIGPESGHWECLSVTD